MMKKSEIVNENDVMVIRMMGCQKIQYVLVKSRTKKEIPLGEPVPFSLSVKKYFGVKGRQIRELYDFKAYDNPKLVKEQKRILRMLENLAAVNEKKPFMRPGRAMVHTSDDDELVA